MKAEILAMIGEARQSAENTISMTDKLYDLISRIPAIPVPLMPTIEKNVTVSVETASQPVNVNVTLEVLRAALAKKASAGFTDKIKTLMAKYGAEKLPELAPEHYASLLVEVERLE